MDENDTILVSGTVCSVLACLICVLGFSYYETFRERREIEVSLMLDTV